MAPALLLLIFASMQIGLWAYGRSVALQAAREGVSQYRLAADQPTALAWQPVVETHVGRYARSVGRESLLDPRVRTTWTLDAAGRPRVGVDVAGSAVTLVPGLHLRVAAHAEGVVERFGDGR